MMSAQSGLLVRRRVATALVRIAAVAAASVMLSGCYVNRNVIEPHSTDYRDRHPISVEERNRKMDLFVGTNRGTLNPTQRAEVMAFASAWKRESTGGMVVDVPVGTKNERAAAEAANEIQALFAAADVPPGAFRVRPYRPSDPGKMATIKMNYPRIVADAGPCGLWPRDLAASNDISFAENRPYWNLGCATQRNLAAMIDDPADLVQPRGEQPAYTPRRTTVLEAYRRGQGTATSYANPNQGRISDVGQ